VSDPIQTGSHFAQINMARAHAPLTDPLLADFVAQLDEINALADRSPGFVWRLQTETGNATDIEVGGDPRPSRTAWRAWTTWRATARPSGLSPSNHASPRQPALRTASRQNRNSSRLEPPAGDQSCSVVGPLASGSDRMKRAPWPGWLDTVMSPPMARARSREIARPKPRPAGPSAPVTAVAR